MECDDRTFEPFACNPWETLNSRIVYENPWIRVREDQVLRPDGQPGIYGVVEFHNKAVGVIAHEDGYIYLVGQFRYPLNTYSWEIPEGGCPHGEDPLAAAKRELKEETGLSAELWTLTGQAHLSNSVSNEEALWYLAEGLTHGDPSPEETERLSVTKVSVEEAVKMVMTGKITDAISVMAILAFAVREQ
jgi:8-oxo-dGTP pyrophosphatase MutT (NUDIX family)